MSDIKDILKILGMFANVPKFVVDPNTTPGDWLAILQDLDADLLHAAALQYLSENNQFTPVPTPGIIRDKAIDLEMLAVGVPTAGEAWGMVMEANKITGPTFCEEGAKLRDIAQNPQGAYWSAVANYDKHLDKCTICNPQPRAKMDYNHPLVERVVLNLGGRDAVITDNPAADRARFIEAYKEIYIRERGKHAMLSTVKDKVLSIQRKLDSGMDPVYLIGGAMDKIVDRWDARKDLE